MPRDVGANIAEEKRKRGRQADTKHFFPKGKGCRVINTENLRRLMPYLGINTYLNFFTFKMNVKDSRIKALADLVCSLALHMILQASETLSTEQRAYCPPDPRKEINMQQY